MIGALEISLLSASGTLFTLGWLRQLHRYRSLFWAGSALALITGLFPRPDNALGQYLFGGNSGSSRIWMDVFGVAWWLLGAWLLKSLFDLILRRTVFPDDGAPHSRRLFADLASGLIYVVAILGIFDMVFKQPISGLLATSGVVAIVLGLALQNTLGDVFSGLAINIERPFRAGHWITTAGEVEGRIVEINWRATRIKTWSNDVVVIPNSVIAKAIVTNHHHRNDPYVCTLAITVDQSVSTDGVIDALQAAALASPGVVESTMPKAYARGFSDSSVAYDLYFAVKDFTDMAEVRSDVIRRVQEKLRALNIQFGNLATDVRLISVVGNAATTPSRLSSPPSRPPKRTGSRQAS
jgi:small-conductance mechanosensitive channel